MNNSRTIVITLFVFLLFIILVITLVDVQIIKSEELKYYASRQQTHNEVIKAERGLIFDRNNVLLALNRNDISFYLDLRMLQQSKKEEVANIFSAAFGKSKKHYLKLLSQSGKTICLEKKASSEKANKILSYKNPALFYREDPTRIYQYGSLASHVLGYVNNNYEGVNGISKYFNDDLNGEDGIRLVERNAIGDMISIAEKETKPAVPGNNIYLTIDKTYQSILEEELNKGIKTYGGEVASGIIMNPNTGEILALANSDDYDPNKYWAYSDFQRKNHAITDTYEPGSTFKAVTLAALLQENKCTENEIVFVENGKYKFRNKFIHDTHKNDYLTVKGILEESSNIGIAKLVQRIDDETYYKYIRDFGFGAYTSVALPGEVKGKLIMPDDWSKLTKTYLSFGYGIAVTPLQLITAYSAIINGGTLYKPQIVKKKVDKNGNLIFKMNPVPVRKVLTDEISDRMRKMLTGVVKNGTGENARLDIIQAGGKTGTSKIVVNGKYSGKFYNASFIGFFPADTPELICLILVSKPEKEKYGGKVAAPIFKNVAEKIVKSFPDQFKIHTEKNDREIKNPANENTDLKFVSNEVNNNSDFQTLDLNKNVMPDLKGRTVKEALVILKTIGLGYKISGSGVVVEQSINPGKALNENDVCKLSCSEISLTGVKIY